PGTYFAGARPVIAIFVSAGLVAGAASRSGPGVRAAARRSQLMECQPCGGNASGTFLHCAVSRPRLPVQLAVYDWDQSAVRMSGRASKSRSVVRIVSFI